MKYPNLALIMVGLAMSLGFFVTYAAPAPNAKVVLESPRLRVEIDPAGNGRIASFFDKKKGVEHLEPAVVREEVLSPLLPVTVISNHGGLEDWFWKQYVVPRTAYHWSDQGENASGSWVTVAGKINGIEVERRVTLLKSLPALQIDVALRSDPPVEASYWLHIVVAEDQYLDKETGKGTVAGAFSGDASPRQGRGMRALSSSGPQKLSIGFEDAALAPEGNWFARISRDGSAALALVVKAPFKEQGGFFYVWQNTQTRTGSLE